MEMENVSKYYSILISNNNHHHLYFYQETQEIQDCDKKNTAEVLIRKPTI